MRLTMRREAISQGPNLPAGPRLQARMPLEWSVISVLSFLFDYYEIFIVRGIKRQQERSIE